MRNSPLSVIVATFGMVVGLIALIYQTSSIMSALFFFPFVMGPLVVTAALGSWLRGRRCQDFLTLGSVLYIGWVVCDHFNVTAEVPLGEVTDHPDPMPGADDRFKCRAMIPREAADLLIAEATRRGNSLGDYVAKVLCDRFGVPFEPRVKKKALRAWQMASEAGEQLPMTG